jgi:hypothetical protein
MIVRDAPLAFEEPALAMHCVLLCGIIDCGVLAERSFVMNANAVLIYSVLHHRLALCCFPYL